MTVALSILVFLLVLFSFVCGRLWGYSDGYSASMRDMKKATRDGALNMRKLSFQSDV
jgi:hypothetical protein